MNELGNTPADKNYKPSGISRAEERALETYPNMTFPFTPLDLNAYRREAFINGYEQAEKDILAIVKKYLEKGLRCMELSDKLQFLAFWDGFHNCAENILREMEDRNE